MLLAYILSLLTYLLTYLLTTSLAVRTVVGSMRKESAQHDKSPDGSRGEAYSYLSEPATVQKPFT